jgi:dephospho-CoA kinase
MVIGVAGKYCAGKNTVVALLEQRGYSVIDVDGLGHKALNKEKRPIIDTFSTAVLDKDGKIDRKKLGEIVFGDAQALQKLEQIVHPRMVEMVRALISEENRNKVVINAALLFHMGLHRECDLIFWVKAPLPVRMKRAIKRDSLSLIQAVKRFWSQRKLTPQSSGKGAEIYYIRNSGNKRKLKTRVDTILALEGA